MCACLSMYVQTVAKLPMWHKFPQRCKSILNPFKLFTRLVHVWIGLGSFLYICIARLFVYGDRVTDPFCPMFAHLTPEFTEAMSERIFLFNKVSISGNHFSFPGSFFGLKIESKTFFGDISPFVCVVLRSSGKSEGDDDDVL